MRVFVALDIPEEVRQALGELVARLEPATAGRGARWARVAGVHVTLKFIGEASPEKVESIKQELRAVKSPEAVDMRFRDLGFFPNARHPRVFWAGIEASPNLATLAAEIEERMARLGVPREDRPFRPHLTLARFKSEDGLAQLREALEKLPTKEFGTARTEELHLYQSTLKPGGAKYTKLQSFRFVAAEAPAPSGAAGGLR